MITSEQTEQQVNTMDNKSVVKPPVTIDVQQQGNDVENKLKDVKQIIAHLAQQFPKCFTLEGEAQPLKIGIFRELTERVKPDMMISRTQLRQALRRYTSSWRYLKSIARGGQRVDLDGVAGDKIEQEHIDFALKELEQIRLKFTQARKGLKQKKFNKKTQKETGVTSKSQAKFNHSKQRTSAHSYVTSKVKRDKNNEHSTRQTEKNTSKINLLPLTEQLNKPGTQVLIKLGQTPLSGVIQKVAKGVIHVQLDSGMVVKTTFENIYLA